MLGIESDIKHIYDRIVKLESLYEKRGLKDAEIDELAEKFEILAKWAQKVSRATGVPLPKL